jgi:hypothetical protein
VGKGAEMTQTLYAHMNKRKKIIVFVGFFFHDSQRNSHIAGITCYLFKKCTISGPTPFKMQNKNLNFNKILMDLYMHLYLQVNDK